MKIIYVRLIIAFVACFNVGVTFAQDESCDFSRKRWHRSDAYRYSVAKSKYFFRMLKGKSKQQVLDILGRPDIISCDNSDFYTYCLNRKMILKYDEKIEKEICCSCKGSLIILDFENEIVSEVTRMYVD